jgi:hypothetical protein
MPRRGCVHVRGITQGFTNLTRQRCAVCPRAWGLLFIEVEEER